MSKYKYTVEQDCDDSWDYYCVVRWTQITQDVRSGEVVYRDAVYENCVAMAEEYQYDDECTEWALNNNQESEFDYV
jgi:hypothetical protein